MSIPNPELLRAEFLGITVRHDDVESDRQQLASVFASIGERYELTRMEYVEGGATLNGGAGSELVMRTAHTAAAGVTTLGFHEGLERVVGMLREGVARLDGAPMWIDDITLVAVWDLEHDDAARDYMTEEVLGLDEERRALLAGDDEDDASHGLRLWRRLGEGMLDAAIEPMHSDLSKLYLRLVYTDDSLADLAEVAERAEAVNAYLHGQLVAFIRAGARR